MKSVLTLALLLLTACAYGQRKSFVPFTRDSGTEEKLEQALKERFEKDVAALPAANKKQTADIFRERYNTIVGRVTENGTITDPAPAAFLASVASRIFDANPSLPRNDLRILFDRSYTANASSMGEGTILFHTGLFHRLQNEAQAAFVLCHEFAHYALNHSNNSITGYVTTVNSAEFQKSLKGIKRAGYGQNQMLENLAKTITFKNRRHARAFEEAADSMALELLRHTGYHAGGALTALALLDSSEGEKYAAPPVEEQFNFSGFPFKKSWLQSDALSFSLAKAAGDAREEDSLKTHPDCSARIARLRDRVALYSAAGGSLFLVGEEKFRELQNAFDYDIIEDCFASKQVSRALYFSLQLLKEKGEDAYLYTMVGKCLNEIYAAQKSHQLGTITDLPGTDHSAGYNKVLNLIQNLRLPEIAALSYHFLQPWEARFAGHRDFQQVFNVTKQHYNTP